MSQRAGPGVTGTRPAATAAAGSPPPLGDRLAEGTGPAAAAR